MQQRWIKNQGLACKPVGFVGLPGPLSLKLETATKKQKTLHSGRIQYERNQVNDPDTDSQTI
jgi:hypothetical protein